MSLTPNMNLIVTQQGVTPGPTYASDIDSNNSTIDQHDHSSGKGVQVPSAGLNINGNVAWGGYNLTNAGTITLASLTAVGAGTLTIGAFTLSGAITGAGNNVTGLGNLAAGGTLNITGNSTLGGTLAVTGATTLTGGIAGALVEVTAATALTLKGNSASTSATAIILSNAVQQTSGKILSIQTPTIGEVANFDYQGWLSLGIGQTNAITLNSLGIQIGGTGYLQTNTIYALNTSLTLNGEATAAGPGLILQNAVTLTSGKIVSFKNNSSEVANIDYLGTVNGNTFNASSANGYSISGTSILYESGSIVTLKGIAASTSGTGFVLNNATTQTSGKIVSFQTGGAEAANIDYGGNASVNSVVFGSGAKVDGSNVTSSVHLTGNSAATSGVGVILDNATTQTTGKIVSVRTGGTEALNIDYAGNINNVLNTANAWTFKANVTTTNSSFLFDNVVDVGGTGQIAIFASGGTNKFALSGSGHFIALGSAPSAGTFHANFGTVTGVAVTGSDVSAIISFTTGTVTSPLPAGSKVCTITLNTAYQNTQYTAWASGGGPGTGFSLSGYNCNITGAQAFDIYNTQSITLANSTTYKIKILTLAAGAVV